jgi:hypothetical protein
MLRIPGNISLSIPGILQSSTPILYSMARSRMLFADIQQLTCTALSFANLWCRSATVCCLDLRSRAGRIYQRSVQRRPPDHNCHFQFSPYDYCDSRQLIETSDSRNDAGGEPSQLQPGQLGGGHGRDWAAGSRSCSSGGCCSIQCCSTENGCSKHFEREMPTSGVRTGIAMI